MCGDGAEGTSAKASAVDVDGELDHVEGGYALAFVFGVGLARVGQVEGGVNLGGGHRGVGGIDYYVVFTIFDFRFSIFDFRLTIYDFCAYLLQDAVGVHHVGLLLDVAEVLGLGALVAEALLVAVEDDVVGGRGDVVGQVDGLRQVADGVEGYAVGETGGQLDHGLLRPHVVAPVGAVGVLGAQAACGGVLVDHGVHAAG